MGLSIDIAKADKREEAVAQAAALARYPNVSVKLSSATTYSFEPYPYRDMTPFIRRLYDSFGPQRCYWGTDMTNSYAKATYRQRITHFTRNWRSSRRRTRTGSWGGRSWGGWGGLKRIALNPVAASSPARPGDPECLGTEQQ